MTDTAPRAAILEAARGVLDTVGYRRFTVEAVAVRAKVGRAVVDDEVWVAPLVEVHPWSRTSRSSHAWAGPGPEWETGTLVDVVVQLWAERAELVRVPNQRIERTE